MYLNNKETKKYKDMKKLIYSALIIMMAAFTFTSCEDVPSPYDVPTSGSGSGGGGGSDLNPLGSGTADDPYNIDAVIDAASKLASGETSSSTIYFKGKVVSIKELSASFGNATFYISDDGTTNNQFYVYRCLGPGNKNISDENLFKVGDELVICGKIMNYNGTLETSQKDAYIVSVNGQGGDDSGEGSKGEPKGTGTEADPFNATAAIDYVNTLGADVNSPEKVYIKGKVCSIKEVSSSFGNATFYLSDDGTTEGDQFYVFRCLGFGGDPVKDDNMLKVGDEVVVYGTVVNFKGNTPETVQKDAYIVSVNGKSEGSGDQGGDDSGDQGGDGATGTEMTAALINRGQIGSVALNSNNYGSQSTDESTWYVWKFNDITFKGFKLCNATDTNGGGIQIQGHASDATKQGFFFNADAFASSIKSVTLVFRVVSTSQYDPSYSFYCGGAAHPTSNALTPSVTQSTEGNFRVYTEIYDLSNQNAKYFTVANDKAGALYIDKVVVTLQ